MHFDFFLPGKKWERKTQFGVCLLLICSVAGICLLFSGYIGSEVVAFILLLTLSVIAMFFDILPVLFSAVLSALVWDFLFLHPRFTFQVGNTEDRIMLSMYFVIALVNAVLTFKIRQIEKIARQREEKANTVKLYNTLLNSLSHEFRTPLATIIGATDNLMEDRSLLSDHDQKNLLSEISIASLRLNQQVENLLNMSRLESGFIQPRKDWCDINELVCDAIHRLEEQLMHHEVVIGVEDDLPLFRLDYGLMEQVLYNLLYNASLYTPPGSKVVIEAKQQGAHLLISVSDNGSGFPQDEIHKVFEKFYRVKNTSTGGSGLGLSIARGFVEAHEGTIHIENAIPSGATIIINLPAEYMQLKSTEHEPGRYPVNR